MSKTDPFHKVKQKKKIKLNIFNGLHLSSEFKLESYFKTNSGQQKGNQLTEKQQRRYSKNFLKKTQKKYKKRLSLETPAVNSVAFQYGISSTQLLKDFDVLRKIGSGSFGQILEFRLGKNRTLNEVKILAHLNQSTYIPQLLKYYGSFEEGNKLYLKMEYCVMNLKQRKKLTNSKFKESELRQLIRDMAEILSTLHKNEIAHMDLKPENILIRTCSKRPRFVLADYSIAIEYKKVIIDDVIEGDAKYLAPELLNLGENDNDLLPCSDIYSLGLTVLELMLDIELPSNGPNWHFFRTAGNIKNLLEPMNYSHDLKLLVERCTSLDPSVRPKADSIKFNFRSPSENERVWLKHLRGYLESKEKELHSLLAVETTYTE